MKGYSVSCFFFFYIFPFIAFFFFYGAVVYTLKKRQVRFQWRRVFRHSATKLFAKREMSSAVYFWTFQSESSFESTRVIDSATNQLTKTAITVTSIFIVCLGYEMFYYTLGSLEVFLFVLNSPLQKVSTLTACARCSNTHLFPNNHKSFVMGHFFCHGSVKRMCVWSNWSEYFINSFLVLLPFRTFFIYPHLPSHINFLWRRLWQWLVSTVAAIRLCMPFSCHLTGKIFFSLHCMRFFMGGGGMMDRGSLLCLLWKHIRTTMLFSWIIVGSAFRKSVATTFCGCLKTGKKKDTSEESASNTASTRNSTSQF